MPADSSTWGPARDLDESIEDCGVRPRVDLVGLLALGFAGRPAKDANGGDAHIPDGLRRQSQENTDTR
jgi:hypothetical protein